MKFRAHGRTDGRNSVDYVMMIIFVYLIIVNETIEYYFSVIQLSILSNKVC